MRTTATIINDAILYSSNLTAIADIESGSNPTIARLRPDAQPNAVISNLREVADWFRDAGINDLADDADRVADNAALRLNPNLEVPANLRASSRVMLELVALARKLQKYEDRELDLARDL